MSSVFGSPAETKPHEKLEKLEENLKECIDEKTQIEKKHLSEKEELSSRIAALQAECSTKDTQIELLAKKISRRQQRVVGLKKVMEELTGKIASLDQRTLDLALEKENLMRKLLRWEPLEMLNLSPEKVQAVIQEKASAKNVVCVETGSLEEDICKLKSLLVLKLKEYKAFGILEKVSERVERRPRAGSCEGCEESKIEGKNERRKSEDAGYTLTLEEVEQLLKLVECPFKTQAKTMQELVDDYKMRVAGLEKKERVLEKIMNTSVCGCVSVVQVSQLCVSLRVHQGNEVGLLKRCSPSYLQPSPLY